MTLAGVVVRWAQLASALGLIGAFTMLLLAGRSDRPTAVAWQARVVSLTRAIVAVLLLSGVAALAVQAAVATGRPAALGEPRTWIDLMLHSRFGSVWMVRQGLLLLLAGVVLLREREASTADWIAWRAEGVVLTGAGAGAMAWAGHAAAVDPGAWPGAVLADAVHLVAAGVWAGALLPLAWLVRAASRESGADARPYAVLAVRRFSRAALAVMLLVIATGLYNAWIQVGSVPGLIGTPYGWLLSGKLALLAGILALAVLARRRILPALSGEATTAGRPAMARLARSVGGEIALAATLLGLTAWLSVTAPARHDDRPYWPLSERLAYEMAAVVPGARTRLFMGTQIAVLGLVGLAAGILVKRVAPPLLAGGAALLAAGLWVALPPLAVDAYPTTYWRPAVPYQAASIASGLDLYRARCATCHGPGGRGDGPGGAGLPRLPADLTAPHTGQHTAGDLYWWVTHGIPAGGMPPFGSVLGPDERWDAINFLRALAAGEQARAMGPVIEPGRAWLAAPDFTFAVGPAPPQSLKELRGRRTVLIVLFALPGSRARLDQLAEVWGELAFLGTEIIAVPVDGDPRILRRLGGDPPILYPVVTDGAPDIVRAYGLLASPPRRLAADPAATPHTELLVDRQGYVRARWTPADAGPGWADLALLRREIEALSRDAPAPPPEEHVH